MEISGLKMKISLSLTSVLYHITGISKAANIAVSNRFELKASDGTEAELLTGKASYYLSTARHKLASYTRKSLYSYSVIFVLNGTKLAQKYKSEPVDYWAGFYDANQPDSRDRMEAEDRIYSKTPFITPSSRYITEIHAQINDKRNKLIQLKRFAIKNKIPIWFYDSNETMILLDKKKSVPFEPLKMEPQEIRVPSEYEYRRKNTNEIAGWLQLYEQKPNLLTEPGKTWIDKSKFLSKQATSAYKNLEYMYNGDPVRQLNAGMNNEKGTAYGSLTRGREDLDRLVGILRAKRWTVKEFCQHLYDTWIKT